VEGEGRRDGEWSRKATNTKTIHKNVSEISETFFLCLYLFCSILHPSSPTFHPSTTHCSTPSTPYCSTAPPLSALPLHPSLLHPSTPRCSTPPPLTAPPFHLSTFDPSSSPSLHPSSPYPSPLSPSPLSPTPLSSTPHPSTLLLHFFLTKVL